MIVTLLWLCPGNSKINLFVHWTLHNVFKIFSIKKKMLFHYHHMNGYAINVWVALRWLAIQKAVFCCYWGVKFIRIYTDLIQVHLVKKRFTVFTKTFLTLFYVISYSHIFIWYHFWLKISYLLALSTTSQK